MATIVICAFQFLGCAAGSGEEPEAFLSDDGDQEESLSEFAPSPDRTLETLSLKEPTLDPVQRKAILAKYKHLDPNKAISRKLLEKAVLTFDANQASLPNKRFLTIVDFTLRSNKTRWFHIEMKTGKIWPMRVAHGRGSDSDSDGYAEKFSNVYNSKASSIGVYRTAESYEGKFGYSLRVDGLSKTNSNVRGRAIVIHPAWYVWESNIVPGMTEGCFGLSKSNSKTVIDLIKNGSMVFVGLSSAP